jgi:hypothetical protein
MKRETEVKVWEKERWAKWGRTRREANVYRAASWRRSG